LIEEKPSNKNRKLPDYGNWVSTMLIYVPAAVALFFFILIAISYFFIIPAVLFLSIFIYFTYAHYKFSKRGGDFQNKILDLVLNYLEWNGKGKIVDIGCGNGALAIKIAKIYPDARITGIDYWGGKWGFSKQTCERNAVIEGVADRTSFQKADASALPFDDESFDAAVSNFVFHEVKDVQDKSDVVKEALRVVKKGGVFVFHDLFCDKGLYGEIDDLINTIQGWGIKEVNFMKTNNLEFIPKALKLNFMLGSIGIIHGIK
jgi:SAM-dependent methyltransferase